MQYQSKNGKVAIEAVWFGSPGSVEEIMAIAITNKMKLKVACPSVISVDGTFFRRGCYVLFTPFGSVVDMDPVTFKDRFEPVSGQRNIFKPDRVEA